MPGILRQTLSDSLFDASSTTTTSISLLLAARALSMARGRVYGRLYVVMTTLISGLVTGSVAITIRDKEGQQVAQVYSNRLTKPQPGLLKYIPLRGFI